MRGAAHGELIGRTPARGRDRAVLGSPSMRAHEGALASDGLRWALELFETTLELYEARLRRERPEATDEEIEELIGAWLDRRRGAELGDADGVLRR
jgi:hypothetical protein